MSSTSKQIRAALIVVDFQEDFCPPVRIVARTRRHQVLTLSIVVQHGSLAVQGGRDIAGVINDLLDLPFVVKIATQDWHPHDHISFASNHPSPNNKPFESTVTIQSPENPSETATSRLWPVHCVQGSNGAGLVPELNLSQIDHVVQKGQDKRVEMYSAFRDPFKNPVSQTNLANLLKDASVDTVFVVGLAADYCVKETALHATEEGFRTFIVEEATKAVDGSEAAMQTLRDDLKARSVLFQSLAETKRVMESSRY